MSKLPNEIVPGSRRSRVSTLRKSIIIPIHFENRLAPCSYVLQQKTEILMSGNIAWDSYEKCKMIDRDNRDFLTKLGTFKEDERLHYLNSHAKEAFEIFMKILRKDNSVSTLHYILALLDDMILKDDKWFEFFKEYETIKESVWTVFFKHLESKSSFTANMASHIIFLIAQSHPDFLKGKDLDFYFIWLMNQIKQEEQEYTHCHIRCLQTLLYKENYRQTFANLNGIKLLVDCLDRHNSFQIDYQLLFCFWMLTFSPNLIEKMENYNVIPVLSNLLLQTPNEKVKRMILASFRNMLEKHDSKELKKQYCIWMIRFKVLKMLNNINEDDCKDPDFIDDIHFLTNTLLTHISDLTSFDAYVEELMSGHLESSPIHLSEIFWKENALNFNKHSMAIKALINILKDEDKDPEDLAVALNNIEQYIRYCENGKNTVINLGGKALILGLLKHKDKRVSYQALLCLQKLLLTNWKYLKVMLEEGKRWSGYL